MPKRSKVSQFQTSLYRITRTVRSSIGISVLDIVIAVFVLTLVLLAAANQFGSYEQSAPVEEAQEQPAS